MYILERIKLSEGGSRLGDGYSGDGIVLSFVNEYNNSLGLGVEGSSGHSNSCHDSIRAYTGEGSSRTEGQLLSVRTVFTTSQFFCFVLKEREVTYRQVPLMAIKMSEGKLVELIKMAVEEG